MNEQQDVFTFINLELHNKSAELLEQLVHIGVELTELDTNQVRNEGIWPNRVYFIQQGNIAVEYEDKDLFIFEKGDIILHPSTEDVEETGLYYTVKSEVTVKSIMISDLCNAIAGHQKEMSLFISLLSLSQLQTNQMIGVLTKKEERANPGFGRYRAGMAIINEGDDADYVYSISEGTAVAVHNEVEVGVISKDEIFGAIAVLTGQKRTASVIAKTDCTVLMVHKDEFSQMVHSHPQLFLNILTSLSEKIIQLNKKVSNSQLE
jgi:CRP-like cAMP-binding protein